MAEEKEKSEEATEEQEHHLEPTKNEEEAGPESNKNKETKTLRHIFLKMSRDFLILLLCYIFLVAPPGYLVNNLGLSSSLSTKSHPPSTPFFESAAWIDDFYTGDIYNAFEEAQLYQDALVFFYAPWDGDSIKARDVLDEVAGLYRDHSGLYVTSVNCWTKLGDCYRDFGSAQGKYNQAQSSGNAGAARRSAQSQFPIFVFYPKNRRGIQYNGPITKQHLVDFIHNVQNPVHILSNKEELLQLRASGDGRALVGYFPNLNPKNLSHSYRRYLHASYEFLESDPFRDQVGAICIVISPKLAMQLQLNHQQPVRYFHWNSSTSVFPNKTITNYKTFMKWTWLKASDKLGIWTGTKGRKSLDLGQVLNSVSGNFLLVFTPRLPQHDLDKKVNLIREIVLSYKTCSTSDENSNEFIHHMRMNRLERNLELEKAARTCLDDPWFHLTFCSTDMLLQSRHCLCQDRYFNQTILNSESARLAKHNFQNFVTMNQKEILLEGEDQNVHSAKVNFKRLGCSKLFDKSNICQIVGQGQGDSTMEDNYDFNVTDQIRGLGCADNRTLGFLFLNSETQNFLAKSIGLDSDEGIVIADMKSEYLFRMEGAFEPDKLVSFIKHFHVMPERLVRLKLSVTGSEKKSSGEKLEKITEVSGSNFQSVIMNSSENVVLLYHSSSCGMCSSFSYIFHSAHHILSSVPNVTFAMVDSGRNDLPLHLTALSVPSVLFIPQGDPNSKAETRAFPSNKAMNLPNLLSFIVANLPPPMRMQLSVKICDDDCLLHTRTEVVNKVMLSQDDQEKQFFLSLDEALVQERMARTNRKTLTIKNPSEKDPITFPPEDGIRNHHVHNEL